MKQIWVVPHEKHLQYHHDKALLIDDHYAIVGSGHTADSHIHLVQIEPTDHEDIYRALYSHQYIKVAHGTDSIEQLEKVVNHLQTISAYTLLTKCYNMEESNFDIKIKSINK
ncbi:hypothetical protein PTI45_03380 [Paenibacillus nuruki]|uniref:PLD phosphodiesterase domain-containing protein n=1 Tax=Paenibacillus nuruki TaxID=1886670 RepID=A0A1E3L261_9BACL|nr:hypothetical protein [Paenibacillus nuruki]ODP27255.1 hypothetical protein PTI45_03380 [Paenibacillus nuruki]